MTASNILHICVTVGVTQAICDLLAKWFIFNKDPYQRAVGAMNRAKWKLDKAAIDAKKNDKHLKRLQRAQDDYSETCSEVARRHTGPGIITSIVFVILLRVMGTEAKGNVIALLPFVPFTFLMRLTARGLDWQEADEMMTAMMKGSDGDTTTTIVQVQQATSFLFVYLLATFSVKFYVHKLIGTPPPDGADKGLLSVMESPKGQRFLKSMGVDPNDLK